MLRKKFDVFEWKNRTLYKIVRNDLEIDTKEMKNTSTGSGITFPISKTFSNTFILICILRCIAQLKEEVLI